MTYVTLNFSFSAMTSLQRLLSTTMEDMNTFQLQLNHALVLVEPEEEEEGEEEEMCPEFSL